MTRTLQCLTTLMLLTGCATIVNGPYQTVVVDSYPSGAKVTADCGRSTLHASVTPTKLRAERAAAHCILTFVHDGYEPRVIALSHQESRAARMNALFGVPGALLAGAAGLAVGLALDDDDAILQLTIGGLALGYVVGSNLATELDEKGGALKWVPGKLYAILLRSDEAQLRFPARSDRPGRVEPRNR